jgi:cellulose synthase/poly-beta-1,6-N-acetylglucosamine synthase-like glycosyltransferase
MNVGVSYGLTELILALITAKKDLPSLDVLENFPKVALIYVTYNDVIPEAMAKLKEQSYKNYDIFVLDDSTDERSRKIVDYYDFVTVRRDNREGFKAGAMNNWINLYDNKYEYFIILDSDSFLEPDFIESMIKYAEHPLNSDVAIFQSKINNHNNRTKFARTLAISTPLANYINDKLANECCTMLSWGHNNLHRTKFIKEIGGFNQKYVSEDYATALNLIKRGYKCKLVDVISYEMMPQTIQSYAKRTIRWAKQNMELQSLDIANISFNTQLHVFMSIYNYLMWPIYFLGILIAIFGHTSSWKDISVLLAVVENGKAIWFSSLISFLLFILYTLNFTFLRLPIALRLGISTKDYCKNLLLSLALSYYILYDIVEAMIKTKLGNKVAFEVTDKTDGKGSLPKSTKGFKNINLLTLIVLIGLLRNPLSILFNFTWLIPLLLSSVIIYIIQIEETPKWNRLANDISNRRYADLIVNLCYLDDPQR